jgi:hypothetical protein
MEMKKGKYNLTISKKGYYIKKGHIDLQKDISIPITLEKEKVYIPKYSLTVNPTPSTARVYITNIAPKYYDGIKLTKGNYYIKVKANGYDTKTEKISLNTNKTVSINLKKTEKVPYKAIVINKNGWNTKIFQGHRSYSKNSQNTVKDNYTNLIWQKKGSDKEYLWESSKQYCEILELDGYDDWRLPTIKELYYLADRSRKHPAIDTDYFESKSRWYWSSIEDSSDAWYVYFGNGYDFYGNKSNKYYVRCVRGGQ